MKLVYTLILCGSIASLMLSFNSNAKNENSDCVKYLRYLPGFLLTNDTGAKAHLDQYGQKHFDDALSKAINEAKSISHSDDCELILNHYLKSWRHGHLRAVETERLQKQTTEIDASTKSENPSVMQPKIEFLSEQTVLLTLPSFESEYEAKLVQLLKDYHDRIASAPNWIIDVRENGGGSDDTYHPLLPWIMNNERSEIGMEWLVTPNNIKAQKQVCQRFMPNSEWCSQEINSTVKLMESASTGQYVRRDSEAVTYEREKVMEPKRPQRIGILIGKNCASSCEQFLLTVRQSFNVKLLGRRTYGALDYSNLRPHILPSKNYELYYATSRSLRLPDLPVDIAGVIPDLYMAKTKNPEGARQEVMRAKNWIEGGSLANTEE